MTFLQALILGIVQGLTEFFPVSSSAHLRLARWLMNIPDGEYLLHFDLICHSGTLLALVLYLRKDILKALLDVKASALIALALAPLVPAYFLLKPLRVAASEPAYLGYFLIFTSLLLFAASKKVKVPQIFCAEGANEKYGAKPILAKTDFMKVKDVLFIGLMQTIALVPGISRSGSTIAAARFLGWDWMSAARFSFLLAIPAILGGQALETLKLMRGMSPAAGVSFACYAGGFCASFAVGLLSVRFVFWIYEKGKVRPFAWYCLGAGIIALWALN